MSTAAIVVGGTRRVGRWVSEALLVAGHRVHAFYAHDDDAARSFADEMRAAGYELHLHKVDGRHAAAVTDTVAMIAEHEGGQIGVLVNSAGPSVTGTLMATTGADLESMFAGNVLLVHNAVLATVPYLRLSAGMEGQGGRIVNFVQTGVELGRAYRDIAAYAAAKAMLLSYSRSLARELAPAGITVNCIALGVAELPPEGVPPVAPEKIPTGRHLNSEDVAAALWYLTGPQASQVTGTVLTLGGGFGL